MNSSPPRRSPVPAIVHIVLSQLARMRSEQTISDCEFETRLTRIEREELASRGLHLLRRELTGGTMRFLIKEATTGAVCDTIEYTRKDEEPLPRRGNLNEVAPPRRRFTSFARRFALGHANEGRTSKEEAAPPTPLRPPAGVRVH